MLILLEGALLCFLLLLVCAVGIANGPVGLAVLYEQDVQDRVVELGLITKARLKRNFALTAAVLFIPQFLLPPLLAYGLNGAVGFWEGWRQMTAMLLIQGLFDRFFIDWYWVGRTKAWIIPGTEDLMPYIPGKMKAVKWLGTLAGSPLIAAVCAGAAGLIM